MSTSESGPGMSSEAAPKALATHPQSTGKPVALRLERAEVLAALPAYILIVKTPTQRVTRRVYLSLHSAVKACERAQLRGHAASLELAEYTVRGESR
ncbi:hypothetical protein ACTXPS_12175 [Brachybacterium tyrofermentans]|uniref:hypothetical protein n=1 Tax=Brachybacterium tyrofermentans TaxID=47848 RepID=UPI003FD01318